MKSVNQRNPILPLEHHVPDSEAHVMPDGRLYLYGSYDLHSDVYCSEEYHVVSTPDLKHWEIEDRPSLRGREIPWFNNPDAPKYPGIDWANPTPFIRKMLAERPVDREAFGALIRRCSSIRTGRHICIGDSFFPMACA